MNLPRLPELIGRTVLVAAVLLGAAWLWGSTVVSGLVPVFRPALTVADGRFYLYSMEVVRDGEVSSLRTRANLTQPVPLGERTAYPFGWNGSPIGGYQVMLTTGGILGYALLLLIAVLAWPTARSRELAMRLLLAMPLLAVLLFLGGPLTILAELWNSVRQTANPESFSPLMAVSRFLMGGGGYALALLAAAVVVRQASCNLRPAIPPT